MTASAEFEQVYREEATRIRAALAVRLGDVGLAEEAVQDAFVAALEHWSTEGVPPNPGGWLATTARRKAIDRLRRDQAGREKLALLTASGSEFTATGSEPANPGLDRDQDDDLLGLIFACCHPALPREAQIALTLRTVCGLTTSEISTAFLVSEATMGQRLSRARRALRTSGASVRVPDPDDLAARLAEVLAVIYLVFNEEIGRASCRERV